MLTTPRNDLVLLTVRLEYLPFCEIAGLVTDSRYRGQGIGALLVARAKQWFADKKCATLRIRSNVKRADAHRFYERVGLMKTRQQKVFEFAN